MATPIRVQAILHQNRLPGLLAHLRPQLRQVVVSAARAVADRAKTSILTGPKSGRIYHRGLHTHQASAPGESPAHDTGVLVAGIKSGDGAHDLQQKVVSTAPYSVDLEIGTTRIAPRPYLNPALISVEKPFVAAVRQVIEKG